jgi:hypothetical protein
MFYRVMIIAVLFLSSAMISHAQASRRIYLGDDMATKFDSGMIRRSVVGRYSFFEFLGYQTLWHTSNSSDNEVINQEGLVVNANSTITTTITGTAGFGENNDSCTIEYKISIGKTRSGRSATVSIFNLLSKKENRLPQDDPVTSVDHVQSKGIIFSNDQKADFLYGIGLAGIFKTPYGWLILDGDTLYTKPITAQMNRRKKLKNPNYLLPSGLLLMKGDSIYAAIDQYSNPNAGYRYPNTIYIFKQLAENKKLIIAAYFFSVTCVINEKIVAKRLEYLQY